MESIYLTLCRLGLASDDSTELFYEGARDNPNIKFYIDKISGIIFIKSEIVNKDEYILGEYREKKAIKEGKKSSSLNYERYKDLDRRLKDNEQFYVGKDIVDFGCGHGHFLKNIKDLSNSICGIELQKNLVNELNSHGIKCFTDMEKIEEKSIDTFFLFHSFEHLPNPLQTLKEIKSKLRDKGQIIIEVPNADDFLLTTLKLESFISSTLWSQHLILHTKNSLKVFLQEAGFGNILVKGIQRYSLSNHLNWLKNNKGGGHLSNLSVIDDDELNRAYSNALSKISKNDTLVLIAEKP
tara:strand:+ start:201 stop:1088 length:888 start_codon:yes stop_codon:yes gene_type:complete